MRHRRGIYVSVTASKWRSFVEQLGHCQEDEGEAPHFDSLPHLLFSTLNHGYIFSSHDAILHTSQNLPPSFCFFFDYYTLCLHVLNLINKIHIPFSTIFILHMSFDILYRNIMSCWSNLIYHKKLKR